VVKNVTGYDMAKLYVGSLGALGVITGAWLRLAPRPRRCACSRRETADADAVALGVFRGAARDRALVSALRRDARPARDGRARGRRGERRARRAPARRARAARGQPALRDAAAARRFAGLRGALRSSYRRCRCGSRRA
jgi:FAD/FMN-containing dehydrogenase